MPRKPKGCSRVDSDTTNAHGWLVRIKRGDVRRSKFVSDAAYGGKAKAKLAARELYEQWVQELPEPDSSVGKLSARNTTGVVGVHYSLDADERFPNCAYDSYIASWLSDDGKRTKIGFSCNRYGDDAFALACLAREKRLTDRAKVLALHARQSASKKKKAASTTKRASAKKKAVATKKKVVTKKAPTKKKVATKKKARRAKRAPAKKK